MPDAGRADRHLEPPIASTKPPSQAQHHAADGHLAVHGFRHMPDEVEDGGRAQRRSEFAEAGEIGYKSSQCNVLYYNPATAYALPKQANGLPFTTPSFTSARYSAYRHVLGDDRQPRDELQGVRRHLWGTRTLRITGSNDSRRPPTTTSSPAATRSRLRLAGLRRQRQQRQYRPERLGGRQRRRHLDAQARQRDLRPWSRPTSGRTSRSGTPTTAPALR